MRKKPIYFLFLFIISCFVLTGCSSFFGSDEALQISSIETQLQSDGSTKVIITYTDENREPDFFFIPKGASGTNGNGIQNIITEKTEDGRGTILKIIYTDPNVEPTIFTISDGVSIIGLETIVDETTGQIYVYIKYSDGTTSDLLLIPRGEKGEDGNSLSGYDQVINEDGSVSVYFHFTKSDDVIITIPAPQKGEAGRGIRSIISSETAKEYILTINYTDGTRDDIKFNRPSDPNKWYNGGTKPVSSLGRDGDYYFDIYHNDIYVKEAGSWTLIIDFDGDEQTYFVRFELNDTSEEPAEMPSGTQKEYQIKRGSYFTSNGYVIPIPVRNGYIFKGWYTNKVITPITGIFTDLTPVFDNIVLYANWEKVTV